MDQKINFGPVNPIVNAHTDRNGRVIEDLMDDRDLVCVNDGRGTRINITVVTELALDITLVLRISKT